MFTQILIGAVVIFLTVFIQVLFISIAIAALTKHGRWLARPPFFIKTTMAMVAIVLWLILGISLSSWSWAGIFMTADVFQSLEPALYFSIVTFTTLGYGDITLSSEWRLLGSFAAVNGLIIFGLNTAFLVEFTSRLHATQKRRIDAKN